MAKTLGTRRSGPLNWCVYPISTGLLKELNNKVQTMKKQAYGHCNMRFFMLKLRTLHTREHALTG